MQDDALSEARRRDQTGAVIPTQAREAISDDILTPDPTVHNHGARELLPQLAGDCLGFRQLRHLILLTSSAGDLERIGSWIPGSESARLPDAALQLR